MRQSQQKSSAFSSAEMLKESIENSVCPDKTAPIEALCSGSTVCFYTKFVSNARELFAADDFSRRHFQMHLFLGVLRVKYYSITLQ